MRAFLLILATVALAGCGLAGLFGPSGGPYPDACQELGFATRQCDAIVARAKDQLAIMNPNVVAIDILPPTAGSGGIGGYMVSRVRFHLPDGQERIEEVWCIGVGDANDLARQFS